MIKLAAEETKKEAVATEKTSKVDSDSKIFALLSYFWILSIIFYILKKDNSFVKFHAKQGMVLFAASLVLWIINIIPLLGQILFFLGGLGIFVLCVIGAMKAYQGEKYKMPVIGDLAEKINF